ncbi:ABC-type transport system involved in multi-copper enzyme maturation, permease component [Ruminococcus sp. YRD2003]|uniref:ABC transporter permease n=1 Tax=Ruminococcus sp. YRD2003 TaxID=1452313 RepID=UPI0008D7C36F|nr:ABC-type transport system involved in multi-copper enzyme maturation, permease component [Ruminococcus flavefaciens]
MLNIIKEMLRQTRRDKLLWFGAVYIFIMFATVFTDNGLTSDTGSSFFGFAMQSVSIITPIILGTMAARICGADLRDKTANYELLFGKKRWEVYFGRFIASLIACFTVMTVIFAVIIALPTALNGWGESLSARNAAAHLALVYPIMFRILCFFTAFTFLCRNDIIAFVVAVVGTGLMFVFVFAMLNLADIELTWHLALSDMVHIIDFSNTTQGFADGRDITVYKAPIETAAAVRSLLASFGIGSFWLFGGYMLFRKRDIS